MRACQHPLVCSWRSISTCNATVVRSLIIASAQHELQHFWLLLLVYAPLSLRLFLRLFLHLFLRLSRTFLTASSSASLSLRLSPLRTLSLCFSPRPPRLPPFISSPQSHLVFVLGFKSFIKICGLADCSVSARLLIII